MPDQSDNVYFRVWLFNYFLPPQTQLRHVEPKASFVSGKQKTSFIAYTTVQGRYLFGAHSFGNSISNTRRVVAWRTPVFTIEQHDHRAAEGASLPLLMLS